MSLLKKNHALALSLSATFLFSTAPGQAQTINDPAPYCGSTFFSNYNMFENIKIKGTLLSFGPMGNWTTPNDYGYYNTFAFPVLQRGESVGIVLNAYSVNDVEPAYFALWIDYNHNSAFEADELILQNANTIQARLPVMGAPAAPITKQVTIPATATPGKTRARLVRGMSDDPFGPYDPAFRLDPCNEPVTGFGNTYDFDIEISNATTGIAAPGGIKAQGRVFPNPAKESITLLLNNTAIKGSVTITDLTGRTVKCGTLIQGKATLRIQDLPGGMYYISAGTGSDAYREKIIIAH